MLVFLVNVPTAAAGVPLAFLLVPESRDSCAARLDIPGTVLLSAGLGALVAPLVLGRDEGWPAWSIILLAGSAPVLTAFWRWERWLIAAGRDPLVAPPLLRVPGMARWLMASLLFNSFAAFFLLFSVYQQSALHRSPVAASLAIVPLGIGFFLSPLATPRLLALLGERIVLTGMGLVAVGTAAALTGRPDTMSAAVFAIGLGQGITLPTLVRNVTERGVGRWAGLTAGLVTSVLQVSGSLAACVTIGALVAVTRPSPTSSSSPET